MGSVVWLETLLHGEVSSNEEELWAVLRFRDEIDDLCEELKLQKLSDFYDSDQDLGEEPEMEEDEAPAYDEDGELYEDEEEETFENPPHPNSDWFPSDELMAVVEGLLDQYESDPDFFLDYIEEPAELIEELESLQDTLEEAVSQSARCRLAITG